MKDVLLEYVMKVDAYAPTPSASTQYIHKVLSIVKPLSDGESGTIKECTTKAEIEALTTAKSYVLLEAGMPSVYVLPVEDLSTIGDIIEADNKKFFTILIDGSFTNEELNALNDGKFAGVIGWSVENREQAKNWGYGNSNVGFYDLDVNGSQNMYYAFGKLLSANNWKNQQYIEMPFGSGISSINQAELMFADSVSFVLTSAEYGNRLALFSSNRRAIVTPYIYEELSLKLQSKALQYISLNQPNYTNAEASLLEDSLQGVVDLYIADGIIESGSVEVELTDEQFVVKASIQIPEPKALWRIRATMKQGEI